MRGTICKATAGFYYVATHKGTYECRARGVFKNEGLTPYVGDDVEMTVTHEGDMEGHINEIHDRKNSFVRPPVANVGQFVVVVAAAKPQPNTDIIDRFLVMAESAKTNAMIVLTKPDLDKDGNIESLRDIYDGIYPVCVVNAKTGEGIEELKNMLAGERSAFAGASGVGKSTILNSIIPHANAETGSVSGKTKRGRHTTRHVELFALDEQSQVFDTPGFTSFDLADVSEEELQQMYPEMNGIEGACRFDDCRHLKEPGCRIKEALTQGLIKESRYESYKKQMQAIKERDSYR